MPPNPAQGWPGQEAWEFWAIQLRQFQQKLCYVWTTTHKSMNSLPLRHLELCFLITRRDLMLARKSERRWKENKRLWSCLLSGAFVASSIQWQTGSPLCTCQLPGSAYLMFTIMWGLPISSTYLLNSSRAEILYISDSLITHSGVQCGLFVHWIPDSPNSRWAKTTLPTFSLRHLHHKTTL